MNCPNCGTSNFDNATLCVNCGRPLAAEPPPPPRMDSYTPPPPPSGYTPSPGYTPTPGALIPNYIVQSILVTFCCCFPLGIVAIVFAAQVNSKLAAGDVAGAQEASRKARMFSWLALGLGLVIWILILLTNGAIIYRAIQDGAFDM